MWNLTAAPPTVIEARVLTRLPDALRRPGRSDWADANKGGEPADCFLEGPSFDRDGHLWLTDFPHGRILRVSPSLEWQVVGDYDGWPNGLALDANGRLVVAHASLEGGSSSPSVRDSRSLEAASSPDRMHKWRCSRMYCLSEALSVATGAAVRAAEETMRLLARILRAAAIRSSTSTLFLATLGRDCLRSLVAGVRFSKVQPSYRPHRPE